MIYVGLILLWLCGFATGAMVSVTIRLAEQPQRVRVQDLYPRKDNNDGPKAS